MGFEMFLMLSINAAFLDPRTTVYGHDCVYGQVCVQSL